MKIRALLILMFFTFQGLQAEKLSVFFSKSDKFFSKYVEKGKVNYQKLSQNEKPLTELANLIAKADLSSSDTTEKKAFYINAYNILVIKEITDNYPIESPQDIDDFFTAKFIVAGEKLSLAELEKKKIFSQYNDIRLVFVISSGMIGSAPILNEAFTPKNLENKLTEQAKLVSNDNNYIRVKKNSNLILLADIFKRSGAKFKDKDIVKYVNVYREEDLPESYSFDFYPGNRKLNDIEY
ncbi:MAG: DUF547 domain-containing protein [Sporocytophaga sp.]|uniref:DUF547 domain-containing protein n=1 Tax=Sporocytophaga sp. TaxID=2231183 RepID=UPI001B1A0531|nr:DUF547 domain-containing protein [Sporocytophaga sp.]MBO9703461.1 DUF547 domain-containing protein [Sporocytophaga sp.]